MHPLPQEMALRADSTATAVAGSLWEHISPPAQPFPVLKGDVKADVAVIGGGYTGLSTAHHLRKAGFEVVVLEANTIASGASGRNGGFVSPRVRKPLAAIAAAHGKEMAGRMHRLGLEAVDNLEAMVEEMRIDCGFTRSGMLTGALNETALKRLAASAGWMARELGDRTIEVLGRADMEGMTGSPAFVGGTLSKANGDIQPLAFARGMARSLHERGVVLRERSPALEISESGAKVVVHCAQGQVNAGRAVIATNAYSNLTGVGRHLYRSIIPFQSAAIATERLPQEVVARVLPRRHSLSDSRRVLRWVRVFDGRVLFGGRGAFAAAATSATYLRLRREMTEMFPVLANAGVEFGWSGLVAMTLDELPHIGQSGERVFHALAYNGTGVAMSNLMGQRLAALMQGKKLDLGLLDAPLHQIPFHAFRRPAVQAATAWMQFLDRIH
jgi:glycine/D-amino acid oxidase-like deaminating enzyme